MARVGFGLFLGLIVGAGVISDVKPWVYAVWGFAGVVCAIRAIREGPA